jgi:YVTN family beta-propeller protein
VAGTGSYITPRLTQAGQIILSTNTEPRSLSDIINFTQKSNLAESQLAPLASNWEQALRTVNRYFGTSQVYKEACTKYVCPGGPPVPGDVETATVTLGTVGLVPWVGVNPTTNKVYVTSYALGTVSVIDGNTNTVTATVKVGANPSGVAVNNATNEVYVANNGGNTVSVIDGVTNSVVANVTVGTKPSAVGVNPTTNRVYVANQGSNTVSVIDGVTNTVTATVNVGTLGNLPQVGVNPTTNRVYVTNRVFGSGSVTVINATNQVMATVTVGSLPMGVDVNPTTNRVYVANDGGNTVSVIDGVTNAVIANVTVGTNPVSVGVNPAINRVYVSNLGSASVSVINATNQVAATVTVTVAPIGVGVNPSANRVYVAARDSAGTVSVISRREEIREACLSTPRGNCLVVSSTGTLFPATPQSTAVNLVAVSLRSNVTSNGVQAALTVICDNNTANPNQQCSAFYVDGNVWGPGQTDLSKSPFIIQNAEPYFYLQFHWWDFANSRIFAWGTWWYGTASNPNWFWGVYWSWRTYVNYYIGIPYIPWWWWAWHWTYWRYWAWWGTAFQT